MSRLEHVTTHLALIRVHLDAARRLMPLDCPQRVRLKALEGDFTDVEGAFTEWADEQEAGS